MFEVLVHVLFQVVVEVLLEVLCSLGFDSLREAFRRRPAASYGLALMGYVILGISLGALSLLVHAQRLSSSDAVFVLGLFVNPLLAGATLAWIGRHRQKRPLAKGNRGATYMTTFWGGFCFASGFSATRFIWLAACASP